ncbi:hypothetical protein TNCV_2238501 [Trichonephila clavipes]|nr:hypothetical protein TNCV_2238501 [Trichonephila clavipes]
MLIVRSTAACGITLKMNLQCHEDLVVDALELEQPMETISRACAIHVVSQKSSITVDSESYSFETTAIDQCSAMSSDSV